MCTLDSTDMFFYGVYASKYNKETMMTLKYDMTFVEYNTHKQFIDTQEDLEEEANDKALQDRER